MAKLWVIEYEVVGHGAFPVDMLRYDASYPNQHAENILMPSRTLLTEEEYRTPRKVRLHHRDGFAKWEPTYDRWSSFGWTVDRYSVRHWSI